MSGAERSFRTEAVVLRHQDWGEADRLLVLFTREHGKVRAVAKGVRKVRSRKAGHLEPFTRVALLLARGRDMLIVTQAETVDAYQGLREELLRTGLAAYTMELLERSTYEEGPNRALYQLVIETLERIATLEVPLLAVRYYELRLLDLLGFKPQLFHCVRCQKEILPESQYFSALLGGVLDPKCGREEPTARAVSMEALRYLRHLQRSTFAEVARIHMPAPVSAEIESLLHYYWTYLLERKLNTPDFLREIRERS